MRFSDFVITYPPPTPPHFPRSFPIPTKDARAARGRKIAISGPSAAQALCFLVRHLSLGLVYLFFGISLVIWRYVYTCARILYVCVCLRSQFLRLEGRVVDARDFARRRVPDLRQGQAVLKPSLLVSDLALRGGRYGGGGCCEDLLLLLALQCLVLPVLHVQPSEQKDVVYMGLLGSFELIRRSMKNFLCNSDDV